MSRPTRPGILSREIDRAGAIVALARRVYQSGGRTYVDAWDPPTLRSWDRVLVVTGGGGGLGLASNTPLAEHDASNASNMPVDPETTSAAQVVLVERQGGGKPICIGALQHIAGRLVAEAVARPEADEDHPGRPGPRDWYWSAGGARVLITEAGDIVLDATGAGESPVVRVQLPAGGVLRVARAGAATERLALAGPLVELLEDFEAFTTGLKARLERAEAVEREAIVAAASAAGGPAAGEAAGLAFDASIAALQGPVTSAPTIDGDSLRAASIHVAADSEGGT